MRELVFRVNLSASCRLNRIEMHNMDFSVLN